jgi:putative toxin-antitoxin system antitoxin component (TIGR02293 family)
VFDIGKGLSPLEVHDLVTQGLAVEKARELMESFRYIDRETVLKTMGISERTLQRARAADEPLDSNASDRTLRLAAVTEQAIEVLGSQDAAERWLATPALGLNRRRPIDLLQSSEGAKLVKTLLTRMDHGVYA